MTRAAILLLLLLSSCSLHISSDEARFTRDEAAIDAKADASRVDAALRQLQQLIQAKDADIAAIREKVEGKK